MVEYYFDPTTTVIAHDITTDPTTGLRSCVHVDAADAEAQWDSAKYFRKQLAAGWLTVVGRTSIDGEDVYRLRPSRKYILKNPKRAYGDNFEVDYVDAKSYRLVRFENLIRPCNTLGYQGVRQIYEYKTWEYLPPTAANLALADIQKQHPDARTSTYDQLPRPTWRAFEQLGSATC